MSENTIKPRRPYSLAGMTAAMQSMAALRSQYACERVLPITDDDSAITDNSALIAAIDAFSSIADDFTEAATRNRTVLPFSRAMDPVNLVTGIPGEDGDLCGHADCHQCRPNGGAA